MTQLTKNKVCDALNSPDRNVPKYTARKKINTWLKEPRRDKNDPLVVIGKFDTN